MHRKHLKTALTTALRLCWVAAIIVALCVGSAQADGGLASPFAITSHDPTAHEVSVALDAGIQATFDDDVNMGTVNNYTFAVHGNMGGFLSGSFAYDGPSRTVTLTPGRAFHAGEELRVSATAAVSSGDGTGLTPYGWQFTAGEVFSRPAPKLYDTGASLPNIGWGSAAWGDYDRDGDLDLVLIGWSAAASGRASYVYRNDGGAVFSDISAGLTGVQDGEAVWGDYDRDGDLDILLTGSNGTGVSELYRNNGDHTFTDIGAALGGMGASCAAWGDYDNDGDLDILLAGRTDVSPYRASRVYRNDGSGTFTDIGAALIGVRECSVAWGDLDNDGDLDIALAGLEASYGISKLYRNNGDGTFGDMGAGLQSVVDAALAFGDYDNDGDLDLLLTGNAYYPVGLVSRLYRNNDGDDTFTNIGAGLIGVREGDVAWGDYDNDGDLDILLSGASGEAPTPNPPHRRGHRLQPGDRAVPKQLAARSGYCGTVERQRTGGCHHLLHLYLDRPRWLAESEAVLLPHRHQPRSGRECDPDVQRRQGQAVADG
jgi:hypothetical protein